MKFKFSPTTPCPGHTTHKPEGSKTLILKGLALGREGVGDDDNDVREGDDDNDAGEGGGDDDSCEDGDDDDVLSVHSPISSGTNSTEHIS